MIQYHKNYFINKKLYKTITNTIMHKYINLLIYKNALDLN